MENKNLFSGRPPKNDKLLLSKSAQQLLKPERKNIY